MKKIVSLALVCFMFTCSYGQKITLVSGSLLGLKDASNCTVSYKYDNMIVGKKKESEYIKEKTAKMNKDEAGTGDKWAKAWVEDRSARFQPKFEELFNEHSAKVKIGQTGDYKLIVHTNFTEPGFNVGVMKKYAMITMNVKVLDKSNKQVAEVNIVNAPGRTYGYGDFDTGVRIMECYAVAGKDFAKFISKAKK